MKITLLTYGSRGDVQPFMALALVLLQRGHTVRLAAPHRFAEFAAEQNIPFVPLAGNPEEISRRINDAGANVPRMIKGMSDYIFSIAGEVARSAFAACENADLIIHSFLFTTGGHSLARQMGIPDISAQLFPVFLPTSEFPNVAASRVPPGLLSEFTHWAANQIFWFGGNSGYARLRRQSTVVFPLRLYWPFRETRDRPQTPFLGAWSPAVLPFPHDWSARKAYITGYWFLDSDAYQPSAELVKFLAAGEKPVCVTFGSMIHAHAGQIGREVLAAISSTGQRAVVLTGWGEWNMETKENSFFMQAAPHEWLFPRCKLVIHHGGAGTTAAVARAGLPSIAIPFAADQLFWARRLHALGVTPSPLQVKDLSAGRLEAAIQEALSEGMLERSRLLGEQVSGEDGTERGAVLIEKYVENFKVR